MRYIAELPSHPCPLPPFPPVRPQQGTAAAHPFAHLSSQMTNHSFTAGLRAISQRGHDRFTPEEVKRTPSHPTQACYCSGPLVSYGVTKITGPSRYPSQCVVAVPGGSPHTALCKVYFAWGNELGEAKVWNNESCKSWYFTHLLLSTSDCGNIL